MRRKVIPEMLDEDAGTTAEVEASLNDLRHINDWFGGTRTTIRLLQQLIAHYNCRQLSLLEVGSGSGHVPLAAQGVLRRQGVDLRVTLLDRMSSHLPRNEVASVAGDAVQLPFCDDAVDVVSCSLFVHHLEPDTLVAFAREALRVSRKAVLINDLSRSPLHLALVYAGLPLFRSHITWHDAPASVRRAYTRAEMRKMLSEVPAQRVTVEQYFLYRMGVLLWKAESSR